MSIACRNASPLPRLLGAFVGLVVVAALGCSAEPSESTDESADIVGDTAKNTGDSGAITTDTAKMPKDSGSAGDSAAASDSGSGNDSGAGSDSGAGDDAGPPNDAAKPIDAGPPPPIKNCESNADCVSANACAGERFCKKTATLWSCVAKPGTAVVCPNNQDTLCSINTCDPKTGACAMKAEADGTPCTDSDPCVVKAQCAAGKCKAGSATWCQCKKSADCLAIPDHDACLGQWYCDLATFPYTCRISPNTKIKCDTSKDTDCTATSCDSKTGKCATKNLQNGTKCSDGDPQTVNDACDKGTCKGGKLVSVCEKDADCDGKEDGNVCNGTLFCDKNSKACTVNPATIITCPSAKDSACIKNTCNTGSGVCEMRSVKNGHQCDDGDKCTAGDLCIGGQCAAGSTYTCPCKNDAECAAKDDGDLCNGTMFCNLATKKCQHNPKTIVQCKSVDDTTCAQNACDPKTGKCAKTAAEWVEKVCDIGAPGQKKDCRLAKKSVASAGVIACEDGDACTKGDRCKGGQCISGPDTCPCKSSADCLGYDDGNLCNGVPTCDFKTGKCDAKVLTKPIVCAKFNDTFCLGNACQAKTGQCQLAPRNLGKGCDDGKPCTVASVCDNAGSCVGGKPNPCDDNNPCTQDKCLPPTKTSAGGCSNPPKCTDANVCTVAVCDPKTGSCTTDSTKNNGKSCLGDGSGCTLNDACKDGVCKTGSPVKCSLATKACEVSACHSTGPSTFQCIVKDAADKTPCEDGDLCRLGDACKGGKCVAGDNYRLGTWHRGDPTGPTVFIDVAADFDDGLVAVGYADVIPKGKTARETGWIVQRYDSAGRSVASNRFFGGASKQTRAEAVAVVAGGNKLIVAGRVGESSNGPATGRVMLLSGKVQSQKVLDFGKKGPESVGAIVPSGTDFVIAGSRTVGKDGFAFIGLFSESGKSLAEYHYKGMPGTGFAAALRRKDGKLLAVGTAIDPGTANRRYGIIVRHDATTLLQEKYVVSSALGDLQFKAMAVIGGDLVVGGEATDASGKRYVRLVRLDGQYKTLFLADWLGDARVADVLPTADGGALLVGRSGPDNDASKHRWWLRSFGATGAIRWDERYQHAGPATVGGGVFTSTGNVVLVGSSQLKVGGNDVTVGRVLRVSAWGHASCGAAGACAFKKDGGCDDGNLCTDDACEKTAGCTFTTNVALCNDGNACTHNDFCKAKKCSPGKPVVCKKAGPCEVVACDPTVGCKVTKNKVGTACDDGKTCTKSDVCLPDGGCAGNKDPCLDGFPCTIDACDEKAGCTHAPNDKLCDDNKVCTDNRCDAKKGCVYPFNRAPCDDGLVCSTPSYCKAGTCVPGVKDSKLWFKPLPNQPSGEVAQAVTHDGTGGFFVASRRYNWQTQWHYSIDVHRYDATGKRAWTKAVGEVNSSSKTSIERIGGIVTSADGAILVGHTNYKTKGSYDGYGVGVSRDGSRQWYFRYGSSDPEYLRAVARAGSTYVAAGNGYNPVNKSYDGWLLRLSGKGFQVESTKIAMAGQQSLHSIVRLPDGFAAAGSNGDDWWVVRLDDKLKVKWERTLRLSASYPGYASSLTVLPDGALAMAGEVKTTKSTYGGFAVVLSAAGVERWRRFLGWRKDMHIVDTIAPHGVDGVAAYGAGGGAFSRTLRQTTMRASDGVVVHAAHTSPPHKDAVFAPLGGLALPDGVVRVGYHVKDQTGFIARIDGFGAIDCGKSGACSDKVQGGCEDGKPCTSDGCTAGKCVHVAASGRLCDGKQFCAATSACDASGSCKLTTKRLFTRIESFETAAARDEDRYGVVALPDGGFAAFGRITVNHGADVGQPLIARYGPGGARHWYRRPQAKRRAWLRDGVFRKRGGILAVGYIRDVECSLPKCDKRAGYIVNYDLAGNETFAVFDTLASKNKPSHVHREFQAVVEVSKDRFVVVGSNEHTKGNHGMWIYGIDAGDTSAKVIFSEMPIFGGGVATGVAVTAAGEAAVSGSTGSVGYFNAATGKLIAWASVNSTANRSLHDIATIGDGVLAVGRRSEAVYSSKLAGYLAYYDKNRKRLWEKSIDGDGADYFSAIEPLADGRFVLGGVVSVPGKNMDARVTFIDALGTELSEATLGTNGRELVRDVAVLADGRIAVVGVTGGGKDSNGYYATVTPWGHTQCVTAGECADTPLAKCIDSNPCTFDSCSPAKGCIHSPMKDGTACMNGKKCKTGFCQ